MLLKLKEKVKEAMGTTSFLWESEKSVSYLPGQYFYYTLPKLIYPDSKGPTRHFTLSSSPTEGKLLKLTTKIRKESGFKQTLDALPIGSQVEGEGPSGTFIIDEHEAGPHIFIAGGIGITPFRSAIKYAIDKNTASSIHLLYSNSIPEEIAFRDELSKWDQNFDNIKVDFTITKPDNIKSSWNGLTGRIDQNMLNKVIGNWKSLDFTRDGEQVEPLHIGYSKFWLCGPPPMVDAMEKLLGSMKITSDRVRSEKFTGY